MAQVAAGGVKGALLSKAINAKIQHYRKTGEVKHAIYDALVFRKVRVRRAWLWEGPTETNANSDVVFNRSATCSEDASCSSPVEVLPSRARSLKCSRPVSVVM